MKKSQEPSRDFYTLDTELDTAFAIDRIKMIKSNEEDPSCPVFETVDEYVGFYRRIVGRRIAIRESLLGKSDIQAIDDEVRHLQQVIGSHIGRLPETIMPEERFGEIVPIRDQWRTWKDIFAEALELLPWSGTFFWRTLAVLLVFMFFVNPALGGIALTWFPEKIVIRLIYGLMLGTVLAIMFVLLLQIFYFRHRCKYHASTLWEIATKIVEAKKQYASYPVTSVEEVEPLLLQTLSEKFDIPLGMLKPETRLDTDLGFVL